MSEDQYGPASHAPAFLSDAQRVALRQHLAEVLNARIVRSARQWLELESQISRQRSQQVEAAGRRSLRTVLYALLGCERLRSWATKRAIHSELKAEIRQRLEHRVQKKIIRMEVARSGSARRAGSERRSFAIETLHELLSRPRQLFGCIDQLLSERAAPGDQQKLDLLIRARAVACNLVFELSATHDVPDDLREDVEALLKV